MQMKHVALNSFGPDLPKKVSGRVEGASSRLLDILWTDPLFQLVQAILPHRIIAKRS